MQDEEFQSDCASTVAESHFQPARLNFGSAKPVGPVEDKLFRRMVQNAQPVATIDVAGRVHHGKGCPCATAPLARKVGCICEYDSARHNDTCQEDYYYAYRAAVDVFSGLQCLKWKRLSQVFDHGEFDIRVGRDLEALVSHSGLPKSLPK